MVVKQLVTAEELWEMPEVPGMRHELVAGEIVEVPGAGGIHNLSLPWSMNLSVPSVGSSN